MATDDRTIGAGDAVARAHARLLADHSLQFQFTTIRIPPPPSWMKDLLKTLRSVGQFLHALGPVTQIAFWLLVASGVLALAFYLWRAMARSWDRLRPTRRAPGLNLTDGENLRPTPKQAAALLEEADRLAAQQRFEEAVHVLLFRTIADLEARRPRAVRPALTSRDIAALAEIPKPARQAFGAIAERVERSFFGGRSLDAEEFSICRAAYTTFASARSWMAGATA